MTPALCIFYIAKMIFKNNTNHIYSSITRYYRKVLKLIPPYSIKIKLAELLTFLILLLLVVKVFKSNMIS